MQAATAASRNDTEMQLHRITSALAGVYGMKGVKEPGAAPSKPVGNDAVKEPATSGRSPAPGNLTGDEEAGVWSQYDKYRKDQYNWNWPEKLGFVKTILPVGARLDRYGEPGGGIQILPNMKERVGVDWLIKNEYIREVH